MDVFEHRLGRLTLALRDGAYPRVERRAIGDVVGEVRQFVLEAA